MYHYNNKTVSIELMYVDEHFANDMQNHAGYLQCISMSWVYAYDNYDTMPVHPSGGFITYRQTYERP